MTEPRPGGRVAAYPGSFDPPTIAHRAVAEAALTSGRVDRVEFVLSRDALGKARSNDDAFARRRDALARLVSAEPALSVAVTPRQLIAGIAAGYDAVIVGADKWRQVLDPVWYADAAACDAALARLPVVFVAPRGDDELEVIGVERPFGLDVVVLDIAAGHRWVSSTRVRRGDADHERWGPAR